MHGAGVREEIHGDGEEAPLSTVSAMPPNREIPDTKTLIHFSVFSMWELLVNWNHTDMTMILYGASQWDI